MIQIQKFLAERNGDMVGVTMATAYNIEQDKGSHWSVRMAAQRFPHAIVVGLEDTQVALEGALARGPVISGTGSEAIALTPEGESIKRRSVSQNMRKRFILELRGGSQWTDGLRLVPPRMSSVHAALEFARKQADRK